MSSTSLETFHSDGKYFEEIYVESYKGAVEYIARNWLPFKESFFACYVDIHLHLGSACTSRVEGFNHAKYLKTSAMDLLGVFEKKELMRRNQMVELNTTETVKFSLAHKIPLLNNLRYKVSHFARGVLTGNQNSPAYFDW